MNRATILLVALGLTIGFTALAPSAVAKPDGLPGDDPNCIQVYPWSEFCDDPVGEASEIVGQPMCNEYWCLA